jgi:hypothetical protein
MVEIGTFNSDSIRTLISLTCTKYLFLGNSLKQRENFETGIVNSDSFYIQNSKFSFGGCISVIVGRRWMILPCSALTSPCVRKNHRMLETVGGMLGYPISLKLGE